MILHFPVIPDSFAVYSYFSEVGFSLQGLCTKLVCFQFQDVCLDRWVVGTIIVELCVYVCCLFGRTIGLMGTLPLLRPTWRVWCGM